MKLIVISSPKEVTNEHKILNQLFEQGLQFFHLRKPSFNKQQYTTYLENIPKDYINRVILHQYHELSKVFPVKGIHFSESLRPNKPIQKKSNLIITTSFHQLSQLSTRLNEFDYVFLSPIFDSISKQGYKANFNKIHLEKALQETKHQVIALGGVDFENFKELQNIGFQGGAILGAIWNNNKNIISDFEKMQKYTLNQKIQP